MGSFSRSFDGCRAPPSHRCRPLLLVPMPASPGSLRISISTTITPRAETNKQSSKFTDHRCNSLHWHCQTLNRPFPLIIASKSTIIFFKERGVFCPSSPLARLFSSHRWTGPLLNPPSFPSGNYLSRYDSMALHFVSEHNLGFCRANILSFTPYTLLSVVKYMYLYGSKRTYNQRI